MLAKLSLFTISSQNTCWKSLTSTCTTSIRRIDHANSCSLAVFYFFPENFLKTASSAGKMCQSCITFSWGRGPQSHWWEGYVTLKITRTRKALTKSVKICFVYKRNPLLWFLSIFISVISGPMYCVHFSGSLIAKLVALHWKRISTGNGSDICHWVGSHIPPPENTNPTEPKNTKEKHICSYLVLLLLILLLKNCLGIPKIIKFNIF